MTKGCLKKFRLTGNERIPCQTSKEEGVETKGDECSPVGWILSPFEAHDNYFWTKILNIYESYKEAVRAVNGTSSVISRICSGHPGLHTHKDFVWRIVDDIVQ